MPLNLIADPWIPVRRKDGETNSIAPWEITSRHDDNPVISVTSPRADFDGAITQFIIGLCQTALPPEKCTEKQALLTPLTPDDLREAFIPLAAAFNLDGDGPWFMQERNLDQKKSWQIDSLLIGMPEDEKVKDNTDFFQKRDTITGLCPVCAAAALFTLQTNAPGGGRGHMTSVRGGGPMTTLILGETLWQTVWANVVDRDQSHEPPRADDPALFPWMGEVRVSRDGTKTTPRDVHPDQVYWAMPRRILLDFEGGKPGTCDLCGQETDRLITRYWAQPYGVKYAGWTHPLSPYYKKSKSSPELLPVHPQPGGITYLNWLGLVINDRADGKQVAENVTRFPDRTRGRSVAAVFGRMPRLWAFGYDMDNKKARCWYQGTLPIITVDEEWKDGFENLAAQMVRAAADMAQNVQWCIKLALYDKPGDAKGDFSVINARFYQATEKEFYQMLEHEAIPTLNNGGDTLALRQGWLKTLQAEGQTLFEEYSQIDLIDEIDTQRAITAWRALKNPFSKLNKKIRKDLDLPDLKKQKNAEKRGE
ncbi:CRISPR system Cascade subunit CasA [Methanofollis sp. W23]|uniref:type I-E CRISPR-associated protein Cse1/CasA n=1 Tax=Methanofollis sp. W23 TaxID=2817849 RepID=UPI001AE55DFE|nr:type I-E CRISPR-associated protein Cse1/CasA [Methanofollis sp. W23]MBP2146366.1 CRISPR system Cascade subunit CasA [Methanofollis sp. W23]